MLAGAMEIGPRATGWLACRPMPELIRPSSEPGPLEPRLSSRSLRQAPLDPASWLRPPGCTTTGNLLVVPSVSGPLDGLSALGAAGRESKHPALVPSGRGTGPEGFTGSCSSLIPCPDLLPLAIAGRVTAVSQGKRAGAAASSLLLHDVGKESRSGSGAQMVFRWHEAEAVGDQPLVLACFC